MRHPMLRGLTIVLALSLAITPIPAFALRAGLEGKTERKIASALTPTTPVAVQSARTGLEERRLDYATGQTLTEADLPTLTRGDYVGLFKDGPPRYYQLAQRWDPALAAAQRLGFQPVDAAGQPLNEKGQPIMDDQGQPAKELRAMTWYSIPDFLAAQPRLVTLAPTWTQHLPDELTGLEEAKTFVLSSEQGQELAALLGSAPAGARQIAWVPDAAVQHAIQRLRLRNGTHAIADYLTVYIARTVLDAVPAVAVTSEFLRPELFWPDPPLPAVGTSVLVAPLRRNRPVDKPHDPILRLRKRGDAAALTPELFIAIGTNPLFMNQEIRLGRREDGTAVTRVHWSGQDGFAFYL